MPKLIDITGQRFGELTRAYLRWKSLLDLHLQAVEQNSEWRLVTAALPDHAKYRADACIKNCRPISIIDMAKVVGRSNVMEYGAWIAMQEAIPRSR